MGTFRFTQRPSPNPRAPGDRPQRIGPPGRTGRPATPPAQWPDETRFGALRNPALPPTRPFDPGAQVRRIGAAGARRPLHFASKFHAPRPASEVAESYEDRLAHIPPETRHQAQADVRAALAEPIVPGRLQGAIARINAAAHTGEARDWAVAYYDAARNLDDAAGVTVALEMMNASLEYVSWGESEAEDLQLDLALWLAASAPHRDAHHNHVRRTAALDLAARSRRGEAEGDTPGRILAFLRDTAPLPAPVADDDGGLPSRPAALLGAFTAVEPELDAWRAAGRPELRPEDEALVGALRNQFADLAAETAPSELYTVRLDFSVMPTEPRREAHFARAMIALDIHPALSDPEDADFIAAAIQLGATRSDAPATAAALLDALVPYREVLKGQLGFLPLEPAVYDEQLGFRPQNSRWADALAELDGLAPMTTLGPETRAATDRALDQLMSPSAERQAAGARALARVFDAAPAPLERALLARSVNAVLAAAPDALPRVAQAIGSAKLTAPRDVLARYLHNAARYALDTDPTVQAAFAIVWPSDAGDAEIGAALAFASGLNANERYRLAHVPSAAALAARAGARLRAEPLHGQAEWKDFADSVLRVHPADRLTPELLDTLATLAVLERGADFPHQRTRYEKIGHLLADHPDPRRAPPSADDLYQRWDNEALDDETFNRLLENLRGPDLLLESTVLRRILATDDVVLDEALFWQALDAKNSSASMDRAETVGGLRAFIQGDVWPLLSATERSIVLTLYADRALTDGRREHVIAPDLDALLTQAREGTAEPTPDLERTERPRDPSAQAAWLRTHILRADPAAIPVNDIWRDTVGAAFAGQPVPARLDAELRAELRVHHRKRAQWASLLSDPHWQAARPETRREILLAATAAHSYSPQGTVDAFDAAMHPIVEALPGYAALPPAVQRALVEPGPSLRWDESSALGTLIRNPLFHALPPDAQASQLWDGLAADRLWPNLATQRDVLDARGLIAAPEALSAALDAVPGIRPASLSTHPSLTSWVLPPDHPQGAVDTTQLRRLLHATGTPHTIYARATLLRALRAEAPEAATRALIDQAQYLPQLVAELLMAEPSGPVLKDSEYRVHRPGLHVKRNIGGQHYLFERLELMVDGERFDVDIPGESFGPDDFDPDRPIRSPEDWLHPDRPERNLFPSVAELARLITERTPEQQGYVTSYVYWPLPDGLSTPLMSIGQHPNGEFEVHIRAVSPSTYSFGEGLRTHVLSHEYGHAQARRFPIRWQDEHPSRYSGRNEGERAAEMWGLFEATQQEPWLRLAYERLYPSAFDQMMRRTYQPLRR